MAFYLVSAVPKHGLMEELSERLGRDAFIGLSPFGATLSRSLKEARVRRDGVAVWEEEDYCRPPLAEERAAVLDRYFEDVRVSRSAKAAAGRRSRPCRASFPSSRHRQIPVGAGAKQGYIRRDD